MRFLPLLLAALTSQGVLGSPSLVQPKERELAVAERGIPETGLDLASRSIHGEAAALGKRINLFWILLPALALPASPVTLAFGVYGLVRSTYDLVKDCRPGLSQDCIFHIVDLAVSAAFGVYKFRSGIKRDALEIDGRVVYGSATFGVAGEVHAHIPMIDGSLRMASIASANKGTWELHATATWNGTATHHILYRQAVADDLGFANDGSYHHYRVQRTPEFAAAQDKLRLARRDEESYGGVVMDYLWEDEDKSVWQNFHDAGHYNTTGSNVANWMETNKAEATCAVPGEYISTHGGSNLVEGGKGVMAYGWNDQPFGFNGRAGGWVDSCH